MSVTCDRLVVFPVSSGFLHQQHWPPRYNWNIVESGILHHQTNKQNHAIFPETVQYYFKSWRRHDKMVLGSIFSQVLLCNNRIIAQTSMIITYWFCLKISIGYHAVTWHSVRFVIVWLKLALTRFHFHFPLHYAWRHNEVINFILTWFHFHFSF